MKRRGSSLLLNLFLALSGVFLCVAFGSGHDRKSHLNAGGLGETSFSGMVTVETQMEIHEDGSISYAV